MPLAAAILAWAAAPTGPVPPPRLTLHESIDQLIAAGHPDYDRHAAPPADDAEFLRRVYLDLNGTVPAATEARAYFADPSPDKRRALVDRLLADGAYARRVAEHFDVVFMERRRDVKVPRAAWEDYLRAAFAANTPYDRLVRDLLSADGTDPKTRPAAKFFLDRDMDPTQVTRDLGRVFLGRDLRCAQCHDHPLVDDYKQADYHGLLAFVSRSYLFPNAEAPAAVLAEKADGEVNFVSVFDAKKTQKKTGPRLPGGEPATEPTFERGKEYKTAPANGIRPVPAYSRRGQLAGRLTSPENPAFARTAVNRLWALMLGRGLVHPLDLDHPGNPPSHPELLDLLATEFVTHGYDMKWLLREIALSRTYQRSSAAPPGSEDVPADRYLVALLKPLSAEQFARAAVRATGPAVPEPEATVAGQVAAFRRTFGGSPGEPDAGTSATLDQALFLKHGAAVRGLAARRPGDLTDRLAGLADPNAVADELFLSVLTRPPTADERRDVAAALDGTPDRAAALAEVVWAVVVSAEFRFNH
ncbi:MAG: DUF1549 and DUF1553 domain-containing protein [Gemmataceae bacterium]|nr:DUF1549 and DUF1553 domain-containing protein [Gemmataceae bacterium]